MAARWRSESSKFLMQYFDELKRSMTWLGEQEKTYFIGQSVCYKGTAIYNTLVDIPIEKRRELPVFEETQMGMTIGLALQGYVPVSIFPRWNFLILATNQLVNHLDKYPLLGYPLGCIIRTAEGSVRPLDPQHQHKGSFSEAYRYMLKTIKIVDLYEPHDIFPAYQSAYADALQGKSTILSENGDFYLEK